MKRYRIDFSVRELDVPEDQARGVRFGDEVSASNVYDFFDRCRDAVCVLFGTRSVKATLPDKPLFTSEERQAMTAKWSPGPKAAGRPTLNEAFSSLMDDE